MAVKRQLKQLQKGVMLWNIWREQNRKIHIDLRGAELRGAELSGVNLSKTDFGETYFSRADLRGINLSGADLSDAELSGVDLNEANLNEANLSGAYLSDVDLSDASLINANLSGVNLSDTHLINANLSGVNLSGVDLSGVNLSGVNLSGVNLSDIDLSKIDLRGANLSKTDLSKIDLRGINLIETDLNEANLSGVNLSGVNLSETGLINTNLSGADLSGVNLSDALLSGANLSGADLSEVTLGRTILSDIDLRTVKGLETIKHKTYSAFATSTLARSQGDIPEVFLRGVGVDDILIEHIHSLYAKAIDYYTCFISYSSKDELFVRRLHNDLQQEGVRCWFAPENMEIGDKIRHRIEESIRMYDKLLLILSEHSIASNWVAYEVERALNKEPQGIPSVLYPIRLDRTVLTCTETWVDDIKSRHIGNFENWTDPQQYEKSFKRLLRALNFKKEQ